MRATLRTAAALVVLALALAACGGSGSATSQPAAELRTSCGTAVVNGQTGISVVLWQPRDSGQVVRVHEVTADWYGSTVTVDVNRDVTGQQPDADHAGYIEVDKPLPPSLYGNSMARGCKVTSWH